jgi:hypothetical protein
MFVTANFDRAASSEIAPRGRLISGGRARAPSAAARSGVVRELPPFEREPISGSKFRTEFDQHGEGLHRTQDIRSVGIIDLPVRHILEVDLQLVRSSIDVKSIPRGRIQAH